MLHIDGDYWPATRHPWSCVLFVVPLLALYEVGLYFLGPTPVAMLRNGADVWLRSGLASAGISPVYGAPAVLLLILLAWTFLYRDQRPDDPVNVWIGMTAESVVFALILYGISRGLWPFIHFLSGILEVRSVPVQAMALAPLVGTVSGPHSPEPALVNLVRYIGAGIYEETLFRLLLFSGLLTVFNLADLPRRWIIGMATLASALLFAGAHNLVPNGEDFHGSIFLFRTLAGVFFAGIYCIRGFGIAVGAHAGYDVLVGLLVRPAPI